MNSIWIVILIIVFSVLVIQLLRISKLKGRLKMIESILSSFDKPLLFFDENDKLQFYSSGLVLFDKKEIDQIAILKQKPASNQKIKGEINIDSNLYRYTARLFEYQPSRVGTILLLEYIQASPTIKNCQNGTS